MLISSLNISYDPKLCHLICAPITNTHQNYPFSCLEGPENPIRRSSEIFHWYEYVHVHTDWRLLFQKWWKWCRIKGRDALVIEKHVLAPSGRDSWGNFPYFFVWAFTVAPPLYSEFRPDRFRFGAVTTELPPITPQSNYNVGFSSL